MEKFYINYESLPFLKTSKIAAYSNRLNWRCEILLTRNQDAIKDKKILDFKQRGYLKNSENILELTMVKKEGDEFTPIGEPIYYQTEPLPFLD